jgi:hypothetical protein
MERLADFAVKSHTSVEFFNQDLNAFMMFKDSIKRILDENTEIFITLLPKKLRICEANP